MKYNDEIIYETENDEIFPFKHTIKNIDKTYKYKKNNPFYKSISFLTYRFFATPLAFIYFKMINKVKFHNKNILNKHKKGGFFIYANHTNQFCDGFCPALICFPKKPHIIVNPKNVSIPFIKHFTKMWGAIPLPNDIGATRNFYNTIEQTLNNNNPILIYPEAHLWPYYTKIRDFSSASFRYPIIFNKPVFTFTTIYKLKKHGKKPKIEIYVDGPFYKSNNLNEKQAQLDLRNKVHSILNERAKLSNYEFIKYKKKEKYD